MSLRKEAHLLVEWEAEKLVRAVLVGFIATVLMSMVLAIAYVVAGVLGSASPEAPILSRWAWGLANNVVTRQAETAVPIAVILHFVAGIGWAIAYAFLWEPHLSGPGWRRGLLFAPIPWAASLLVFLPAVGGGLLGLALGAGLLPIAGNLVLHLVYGVTLGTLYPPETDRVLLDQGEPASSADVRTMLRVERNTASGIFVGLILGGLAGLLISITFAPGLSVLAATMLGVLLGSAGGALLGSFSGLDARQP
jgi:hypothetical protein